MAWTVELFSPSKLMGESGFIVTYSTSRSSTNSAVTDTNGRWIGPRIVSTLFLRAIFHLVEVAPYCRHRLWPQRNILASRNNGYERTTRSNYAQTKNNSTFYPRMKLLRNFYHEYFYHYFETLNFDLIKTARAIHGGLIRFQLVVIKPDTIAAHRVVSRVDFITTINNDNKH